MQVAALTCASRQAVQNVVTTPTKIYVLCLQNIVNGLSTGAKVVWGRVVLKRTVFGVFACARSKNVVLCCYLPAEVRYFLLPFDPLFILGFRNK